MEEKEVGEVKNLKSTDYNYVSEDKVPDLLLCGICTSPYVKPYRTSCNHYFCFSCLHQFIQYNINNKKEHTCPTCRNALHASTIVEETHQLILQQLNSLEIYCINKIKGCKWKGPRSNLIEHILQCKQIECNNKTKNCEWKGKLQERKAHLQNDCQFEVVLCKFHHLQCDFSAQRNFIEIHQKNCPKFFQEKEKKCKEMEDEIKKLEEIKRLEKFRKVEKKLQERREEVLSASPIRINVSGTIFTTSLKTLLADPSSLLFSIFNNYNNNNNQNNNNNKEIFFDCDETSFGHIIKWLRTGEVAVDLGTREFNSLLSTANYFNLQSLLSYLHYKYNYNQNDPVNNDHNLFLDFSPSLFVPSDNENNIINMENNIIKEKENQMKKATKNINKNNNDNNNNNGNKKLLKKITGEELLQFSAPISIIQNDNNNNNENSNKNNNNNLNFDSNYIRAIKLIYRYHHHRHFP